jgi:hypothetical protein
MTVRIECARFERGHVDGLERSDAGRPDAGVRSVTPRLPNGSLSFGGLYIERHRLGAHFLGALTFLTSL